MLYCDPKPEKERSVSIGDCVKIDRKIEKKPWKMVNSKSSSVDRNARMLIVVESNNDTI